MCVCVLLTDRKQWLLSSHTLCAERLVKTLILRMDVVERFLDRTQPVAAHCPVCVCVCVF